jgi:hypothetical protein
LVLIKDGRRSTISYRHTHRLAIAVERETRVAPGDRLQLKFNGKSTEGLPIANGELVTVRRVAVDGSLTIEDDRLTVKTLSPQQRLFNRGYAVTSYASQGKTVDTVLVADAGCRAATNRNQWYVSISRGAKRRPWPRLGNETLSARIINPSRIAPPPARMDAPGDGRNRTGALARGRHAASCP